MSTDATMTTLAPATVNTGGRPTKYCPALDEKICECVRDGVPLVHAATIAGISYQSACTYRKQFPDFDQRVKAAMADGIESRLKVVRDAMQSADKRLALSAATWWLTHVPGAAEHFSESRRLEISGPNGEPPIQVVAVAIDATKI